MIPLERAVFAIGTNVRIESELEVKAYIQNLRLALNSGCTKKRVVSIKCRGLYANGEGYPISK